MNELFGSGEPMFYNLFVLSYFYSDNVSLRPKVDHEKHESCNNLCIKVIKLV